MLPVMSREPRLEQQIEALNRKYVKLGPQIMKCIYRVRTTAQLQGTLGFETVPNIKCKYNREKLIVSLSLGRGRIDGQLRFLEAQTQSHTLDKFSREELSNDARRRYDRSYELYVVVFQRWFDFEGKYKRTPKEKRKMFPRKLPSFTFYSAIE